MRFFTELSVILQKKGLEFIRSPGNILSFSITSIVMTLLSGIISIVVYNEMNNSDPVFLDDIGLINSRKIALCCSSSQLIQDIESYMKNDSYSVQQYHSQNDFVNAIYEDSSHIVFGLEIDESQSPSYSLTIYYNSTIDNTERMKAEISSYLQKSVLEKSYNKDVRFRYTPLNAGYSSASLWATYGTLLASFGMMMVAPALVLNIIDDKENHRMHTLLTGGMSPIVYWFGNFIFDFFIHIIVSSISYIILYLFDTSALTENNWTATYFLYIFASFESLSSIYFWSMFFDTMQTGRSVLYPINNLVVLVPYFIINILLDNDISDAVALVISIIPSFSIQEGLTKAAERALTNPMSLHETWNSIYTGFFGVQIGAGVVYLILAAIVFKIKINSKGKQMKEYDAESDDKNETKDKNYIEMEKSVLNNEQDDEAVVVKHLTRVFTNSNHESFKAVNNLTLFVQKGQIFGVLGANGAGKTTLMSMLTGKINKSSGEIKVLGHDIRSPSDAQAYVSICPQFNNHLFPRLTPREHLKIYGKLKGLSSSELNDMIDEYLSLMDLGQFADKKIIELSGGNQRKVAICLAFLGDHPIVFLDEPTASLDPLSRLQVQELIKLKSKGKTLLLCTHLLAEAESLCDKICIMFSGKINAFGTPQELAQVYGNKWKIELGLTEESVECRSKVDAFVKNEFKDAEIASTKYSTVTYNIPSDRMQLSDVFVILNENKGKEGYSYFTCSMCTLERVFIDLVAKHENNE